jgi:hypothetical protein
MFVLKLQTFFDETCYQASGNERADEGRARTQMIELLLGESTARTGRAEVVARPCVSSGHFWINPYRIGSELLAGSSAKYRQQPNDHTPKGE